MHATNSSKHKPLFKGLRFLVSFAGSDLARCLGRGAGTCSLV